MSARRWYHTTLLPSVPAGLSPSALRRPLFYFLLPGAHHQGTGPVSAGWIT